MKPSLFGATPLWRSLPNGGVCGRRRRRTAFLLNCAPSDREAFALGAAGAKDAPRNAGCSCETEPPTPAAGVQPARTIADKAPGSELKGQSARGGRVFAAIRFPDRTVPRYNLLSGMGGPGRLDSRASGGQPGAGRALLGISEKKGI